MLIAAKLEGEQIMTMVIFFIAALLIVAIIYLAIHRVLINRATLIVRRQAENLTNEAVNAVLAEIFHRPLNLQSQTVADVWGRGVMAFEYVLDQSMLEQAAGQLTVQSLNQALADYATDHQVARVKGAKETFRVTDWWTYERRLHIDIAYLMNEATREYVDDLKKVAKSQGESL